MLGPSTNSLISEIKWSNSLLLDILKSKTYTEFVVFAVVVAIIDTSIDVVAVLVGAVVAGGATTVPLLKLTAPKLEVKAAVP